MRLVGAGRIVMRKATIKGSVEPIAIATPSAVPDSIIKLIAEQGEAELSSAKSNAEYYRNEIGGINRAIEDYKRRNVQNAHGLKEMVDLIEKLSKSIDHSNDLENAQKLYDSLIAYKWVENVTAEGAYIVVKTKLIFGDIRKEAGSDVHERACLGAFELKFSTTGRAYQIKNLTFAGVQDTWSVREQIPCLGDWGYDFNKRNDKKDYAGLIDIMYHYIRAADTDGSSYEPSHQWRNKRTIAGIESNLREGTRVVIMTNYDDSNCEGAVGTVIRVQMGGVSNYLVEFQHEQEWDGEEHDSWWFPVYCLAPITQAQYDRGEAVVDQSDHNPTIKKIDALPDGATQADVEKIIKAAKKKV